VRTEKPFGMKTSTERTPTHIKYGSALQYWWASAETWMSTRTSTQKRKEFKDYLFLRFSDLTGQWELHRREVHRFKRYPKGNTIAIDFNTSYNPWLIITNTPVL
jgi:hypothetical protein